MGKLTKYDREQIEHHLRTGLSIRAIARMMSRDHSVIVRELKRNCSPHFAYDSSKADYFSQRRARKTNKRKLLKNEKLYDFVLEKLEKDWSPEEIAGRLKKHPPPKLKGLTISHEAIYQFVYDVEPWLYHRLRYKRYDRQKHFSRKTRRVSIPDRTSIHERPEAINEKLEIGHFESDSMICKGKKEIISVQYERLIQLVRIHKIQGFNAPETKEALKQTIWSLPDNFVKSITFDNGTEGAKHHEIKKEFNIKTYFCDAYAPWQKGGVENMNSRLRQYLTRKINLENVTDDQIYEIQERLNNRPRKGLDYKTPNEKLTEFIQSGALNS